MGKIVHTGDFKIDHDPMIGEPTNLRQLARISGEGVFLSNV